MRRLLFGATAGIAGTVLMTAAMRQLFHRLPQQERYPMPPREIVQRITGGAAIAEKERQHLTLAGHLAYGAAMGSLFAVMTRQRRLRLGTLYGVVVWALSYLGWIPAAGVLSPAHQHPARRNLAMIAAHLVWGAGMAASLREVERAELEIFSCAEAPDAATKQAGTAHLRSAVLTREAANQTESAGA